MNPDDGTKIESRGQGATVCFLKCLSMEDINNIWEAVLAREKGKFVAFKGAGSDRRELMHENKETEEETRVYRKRKKKENKAKSEESESSRDDSTVEKKPRVHWTNQMHEEFLKAIEQLGHESKLYFVSFFIYDFHFSFFIVAFLRFMYDFHYFC